MSLWGLLIVVLILCLLYWAIHRITKAAGVPDIVIAALDVLLVIIFIVYVLGAFGYGPGISLR